MWLWYDVSRLKQVVGEPALDSWSGRLLFLEINGESETDVYILGFVIFMTKYYDVKIEIVVVLAWNGKELDFRNNGSPHGGQLGPEGGWFLVHVIPHGYMIAGVLIYQKLIVDISLVPIGP